MARKARKPRKPAGKRRKIEPKFKIENIVASANLGVELDLYSIAQRVTDVEYEPEQFPGLVYKPYESTVSVLIFGTGKLVVAGLRDASEARGVVDGLLERLKEAGLV